MNSCQYIACENVERNIRPGSISICMALAMYTKQPHVAKLSRVEKGYLIVYYIEQL